MVTCLFLTTGVQADPIFPTTSLQADPLPTGHQGFVALAPTTTDTGNINTATAFTLGSWISNLVNDGVFAGMPSQSFGNVAFNTTIPTSLTFGDSVFGTFASTSIMSLGGPPGFLNISVLGNWTPGTQGGVTGGPFASELALAFTQTPAGTGAISASGTFSTPPIPEPSSIFLVLTGLAAVVVSPRLRRRRLSVNRAE